MGMRQRFGDAPRAKDGRGVVGSLGLLLALAVGALVLALLAAAAFCGWYILARELPGDSGPPAIVEAPQIIPPATTDLADDLPSHTHYTVFVSKDQASASKAPQAGLIPSKP